MVSGSCEWGNVSSCFTRARFLLLPVFLLCLTSLWSNILALNMTSICISSANTTADISESAAEALNTESGKTWLIGSVAVGAIAAHFPLVWLVHRYRVRLIFSILGILSGVATVLLPIAFRVGFYYVVVLRVLQGIAFASNFIVLGAFTAKWTYYKQHGLFVSALVAYVQLSPTLTNPISGSLCGTFGWSSIFYTHGVFTLLLFAFFYGFYQNSPRKHFLVSEVEAAKIAVNKPQLSKADEHKVPYAEILKTAAMWAVWAGGVGNFFCVNTVYLFTPNYFHYVLDMEVKKTGFSAALPSILQFILKLISGALSDKIKFLGETTKLRVFNSVAFVGSAIFIVVVAFVTVDPDRKGACVILLSVATGMLGISTGGFFKAGPMLSGPYAGFVNGNISLTVSLTMLVVPFITNTITQHNSPHEWQTVFLITSGVLLVTNAIFVFFISSDPPPWSLRSESPKPPPPSTVYPATITSLSMNYNDHRARELPPEPIKHYDGDFVTVPF